MSILCTYNVRHPNSESVNVELSGADGVRVASLSMFSGGVQVGATKSLTLITY